MTLNFRKVALAAAAMSAIVASSQAQQGLSNEQVHERMIRVERRIEQMRAIGASPAQIDALLLELEELSKSVGGDLPAGTNSASPVHVGLASGTAPLFAVAPACGASTTTTNFVGGGAGTPISGATIPYQVVETVVVSGVGAYLWDVNLNTDITHTFNGDLDITLTSPAGTVVTVSTDNGSSANDVYAGTLWDDAAVSAATDYTYVDMTLASPLAPEGRLQAFRGEDPNGIWTLTVVDDAGGDTGNLNSWSIDLDTLAAAPAQTTTTFSVSPALPLVDLTNNDSVQAVATADTYVTGIRLYAEVPHTDCSEIDMFLISPAGTIVTVTTDNGGSNDNCFNGTMFDPDSTVTPTDSTYSNNVVKTLIAPEGGFEAFVGEDPNGNWTLRVFDDSTGDAGSIARWDLEVTTAAAAPATSLASFGQASGALIINVLPAAPVVVTANVTGVGTTLWDLDMTTAISHLSCGDLDITLTSPAGTTVVVTTDNGSTNDDVYNGTLWDDNANDPVVDHVYTNLVLASPLTPEGRFTAFRGEDPNGVWTLSITDDSSSSDGVLNSWSLDVTTVPALPTSAGTVYSSSPALAIVDNTSVFDVINASGLGTSLAGVKVYTEITHTFAGDLDVTLTSPAGTTVVVTTDNGGGANDVFNGTTWDPESTLAPSDYVYTDLVVVPVLASEGSFDNFLGEDPNGTWTLTVADDAGGDTGTWHRWDLDLSTCGPAGPVAYCAPTAPGTSSGCLPSISATGNPDVGHTNSCVLTVSSVEGQKAGMLFYGLMSHNVQWCAGANTFLCVKAPTQRTPVQNTNGTVSQCDGSLTLDWNAYQGSHPGALGQPWAVGSHVYVQGWFRDPPSCKTTFLSEALDMTYLP